MISAYRTLAQVGQGTYKVKGSKHFGYAFPIRGESEAKAILHGLREKHANANHVCYAWSLGIASPELRSSDDGEPSNSAGPPILGQIEKYHLRNVVVAVVRYFGGTKLGVGGLIDAYRTAAQLAIDNAGIVEKTLYSHFQIAFNYSRMSEVMLILRANDWASSDYDFRESCSLAVQVNPNQEEAFFNAFAPFNDIRISKQGTY